MREAVMTQSPGTSAEDAVNKAAYDAVGQIWALTVKARALCPYTTTSAAVGATGYISPGWYRARGAVYFVNLAEPLKHDDVEELNEIASFVNRSFVISMAAVLEAYGVVPYKHKVDLPKDGAKHVQLTRWLRNRFAHGQWEYDPGNSKHVETRELLEELFSEEAAKGSGFVISIDKILEPLKDGVLAYIRSVT